MLNTNRESHNMKTTFSLKILNLISVFALWLGVFTQCFIFYHKELKTFYFLFISKHACFFFFFANKLCPSLSALLKDFLC